MGIIDKLKEFKWGDGREFEFSRTKFEKLLHKTITKISRIPLSSITSDYKDNECLLFFCNDIYGDSIYAMFHDQICCESVTIDDIVGDLDDLIGSPLLMAEAVSSKHGDGNSDIENERGNYSYTWTFYKLATVKGYVTIRWYGSSNGYYSEKVHLWRVRASEKLLSFLIQGIINDN